MGWWGIQTHASEGTDDSNCHIYLEMNLSADDETIRTAETSVLPPMYES